MQQQQGCFGGFFIWNEGSCWVATSISKIDELLKFREFDSPSFRLSGDKVWEKVISTPDVKPESRITKGRSTIVRLFRQNKKDTEKNMRNVEIKARCDEDHYFRIRDLLRSRGFFERSLVFKGADKQTDTYFNVPNGRLKLREGEIENYLIQYNRPDQAGPKESKYILVKTWPGRGIKEALTNALGVLVEVKKKREIYYLNNIKIHLDHITDLGFFLEIEARDESEKIAVEELERQCKDLMSEFKITDNQLIEKSYSDLLLERK